MDTETMIRRKTSDLLKCLEQFMKMTTEYSRGGKQAGQFDLTLFSRIYTLLYDNEQASGAFYNYCLSEIEKFIKTQIRHLEQCDAGGILEKFNESFKSFSTFSRVCGNAVGHANKFFVPFMQPGKSTQTQSLKIYMRLVLDKFSEPIIENLIGAINDLRESENIQTDLIKDIVSIYITCGIKGDARLKVDANHSTTWHGERSLSVYQERFLEIFNKNSRAYYSKKFDSLLEVLDFPEFLQQFRVLNLKEKRIVQDILDPSSYDEAMMNLISAVNTNDSLRSRVEKEASRLREMIEKEKFKEISNIIHFCIEASVGIKQLSQELKFKIEKDLDQIFKRKEDWKDKISLTTNLLEYNHQIYQLIEEKLGGEHFFRKVRHECFQEIIKSSYKTDWLASYCDYFLTEEVKNYDEKELISHLDNIIDLFQFFSDKEYFISHYFWYQYNRLLTQSHANYYAEKEIVNLLTKECGSNATVRLTKLIMDINLSQDLHSDFSSSDIVDQTGSVEMSTVILSSSILDNRKEISGERFMDEAIFIPVELELCKMVYENYYLSKYRSRKLHWLYQRGEVIMETKFTPKPYTLSLNCYQAAILSQFERKNSFTVKELQESTFLDKKKIIKQLKQLCNPKKKLLIKENEKAPLFPDSELIKLNLEFSHPLLKVNYIPKIVLKSYNDGDEETKEAVKILRQDTEKSKIRQMDAAIVAIMKRNKKLKEQDLIEEVFKGIKFNCDVKFVRRSLARLKQDEYVITPHDSKDTYVYVP
ncbi:unnamed protein product [Moneuplotes crassus]|uniref:Cullin family profile domain-containing protein n=1 Tax=Euplotes crassus TaxID=5936 RepID=A0AAD2D9H4_EUPCR|nr:unnamed protein product [Moneuplotes crassus]